MKNSFATLSNHGHKGFIAIPILIIAILGTVVVGGGGYAVYKVNQIEQESTSRVIELERKFEEVNKPATTTEVISVTDATTTDDVATSSEELTDEETEETVVKTSTSVAQQAIVQTEPVLPSVPTVVDVCTNLSGVQTTVPEGYKLSGSSCVLREDKCSNVEGIQDSVPTNMIITKEYGCITEADLDAIEAQIASAERAKREADKLKERCDDAEDELAEAEEEFDKIQAKLNRLSSGGEITQEYRELSIQVTGKANEILILQSSASSACYGYYYAPKTVEDYYPTPKGPIYTNCYSSGYGSIQCTSY